MKKISWVFFAVCLLVSSCKQPENVSSATNSTSPGEIKQDDALLIASNFGVLFNIGNEKKQSTPNARTGSEEKTVKKIKTFSDSLQTALFHLITYNEGGFVIVSAEKRAWPILAFSDTNDFPVDRELPSGVKEIINSYVETIQELRLRNEAPDPNISAEWERLKNTTAITKLIEGGKDAGGRVLDQPVDPGCQDSQILVNLNTAKWGQGAAWNANMPQQLLYGCSNMPNGRMFTGCVATAMAEVMNYHKHPNNFQWANMAPSTQDAAFLMRSAANSVSMMYDCTGSWAFLSSIPSALKNTFGYSSSVTWSNSFNANTLESEILNFSRPVILGGVNGIGHAWVCDGYYKYISCTSSNVPLFGMNWGWDGDYNGFYVPTAADPRKIGSYYTSLAMVTLIKKP